MNPSRLNISSEASVASTTSFGSVGTPKKHGGVNFSPSSRKAARKGKGFRGVDKKKKKKKMPKTQAEMRKDLEAELKEEGDMLAHELEVGEKAAAVTLQANARGGRLRSHYEEFGRKAGAVTVQAAQRGHMERREVKDTFRHPIIDVRNSAKEMLKRLDAGMEPMLKFEDRTTVVWETKGTKNLLQEKLRARGKLGDEDDEKAKREREEERLRKEKEEAEKSDLIKSFDSIWKQKRLKKGVGAGVGEEKKGDDVGDNVDDIESKELIPKTKEIIADLRVAPVFEDPLSDPNLVPKYATTHSSSNSKEPAKINNLDMLVWLGKSKMPDTPLDKGVRAKKRAANFSAFADFVDESIRILDDYKDRERMIRGVDKLKARAQEMIYKDEKDYEDCIFRDQLKHEYLHEKPLVSQRKFQESIDNYKRGEKVTRSDGRSEAASKATYCSPT